MTVSTPENDTPAISVTHISPHGIWLLAHDEQLFMSYRDFPWFKQQPIEVIQNVDGTIPGALPLGGNGCRFNQRDY